MESVRLRVKDIDFHHRALFIRHGKGGKDRVVTLPDELFLQLKQQLEVRKRQWENDCKEGVGSVYLPYALERKYPNAANECVNRVRWYAVIGNISSRLKSCPGNCPFIPVAPQSSL